MGNVKEAEQVYASDGLKGLIAFTDELIASNREADIMLTVSMIERKQLKSKVDALERYLDDTLSDLNYTEKRADSYEKTIAYRRREAVAQRSLLRNTLSVILMLIQNLKVVLNEGPFADGVYSLVERVVAQYLEDYPEFKEILLADEDEASDIPF